MRGLRLMPVLGTIAVDVCVEGCSLKKGDCGMLRCPSCGYENPGESQLLKTFMRWRNRIGTK